MCLNKLKCVHIPALLSSKDKSGLPYMIEEERYHLYCLACFLLHLKGFEGERVFHISIIVIIMIMAMMVTMTTIAIMIIIISD